MPLFSTNLLDRREEKDEDTFFINHCQELSNKSEKPRASSTDCAIRGGTGVAKAADCDKSGHLLIKARLQTI